MQSSFIVYKYKKKLLIYNTFDEVDETQDRETVGNRLFWTN